MIKKTLLLALLTLSSMKLEAYAQDGYYGGQGMGQQSMIQPSYRGMGSQPSSFPQTPYGGVMPTPFTQANMMGQNQRAPQQPQTTQFSQSYYGQNYGQTNSQPSLSQQTPYGGEMPPQPFTQANMMEQNQGVPQQEFGMNQYGQSQSGMPISSKSLSQQLLESFANMQAGRIRNAETAQLCQQACTQKNCKEDKILMDTCLRTCGFNYPLTAAGCRAAKVGQQTGNFFKGMFKGNNKTSQPSYDNSYPMQQPSPVPQQSWQQSNPTMNQSSMPSSYIGQRRVQQPYPGSMGVTMGTQPNFMMSQPQPEDGN